MPGLLTCVRACTWAASELTTAELEHLRSLPQLRELYLAGDIGLQDIPNLPQLRSLTLMDSHDSHTELKSIKGLTQLQTLNLDRNMSAINDGEFENLEGLTQLETLQLWEAGGRDYGRGVGTFQRSDPTPDADAHRGGGTGVTGAGLKHLQGLTQLKSLNLIEVWSRTSGSSTSKA